MDLWILEVENYVIKMEIKRAIKKKSGSADTQTCNLTSLPLHIFTMAEVVKIRDCFQQQQKGFPPSLVTMCCGGGQIA